MTAIPTRGTTIISNVDNVPDAHNDVHDNRAVPDPGRAPGSAHGPALAPEALGQHQEHDGPHDHHTPAGGPL